MMARKPGPKLVGNWYTARLLEWQQVPRRSLELYKQSAAAAGRIQSALCAFPYDSYRSVWFYPRQKRAEVVFADLDVPFARDELLSAVKTATADISVVVKEGEDPAGAPYRGGVPVALQPFRAAFGKQAKASVGELLKSADFRSSDTPSEVAAYLAGGLLSAGMGYGNGWLLEPASPAPVKSVKAGAYPFGGGFSSTGAFPPPIDTIQLLRNINTQPVASQLPPTVRAATNGLTIGAGFHQTGGQRMPRLVSPLAVGKMAAGMGSGWLSGLIVGKVLGALTGLSPSAQKRLRDTGLYAGAIANTVPLMFPSR